VKAWLSRKGVPFTAYDVDEDDRAYDDLIARGFRTIPVTVFELSTRSRDGEAKAEDRTVIGFDAAALADAVAAWRAGAERPEQS
jgi:Glutaredoxin